MKLISILIIAVLAIGFVMAAGAEDKGMDDAMPEAKAEPTLYANQQDNAGEDSQIKEEAKIMANNPETGEMNKETIMNKEMIQANGVEAKTNMEMVKNQEKTMVKLSNGQESEIKIMPDVANERAMERLKLKVCEPENCNIELKEVGQGEEIKAVYQVQAQKESKVFGLFKAKMNVEAQVDAETGEIIQSHKPWWAFLATE